MNALIKNGKRRKVTPKNIARTKFNYSSNSVKKN